MLHCDPDDLPDRDPTPPYNWTHPADCECHLCRPEDSNAIDEPGSGAAGTAAVEDKRAPREGFGRY